MEYLVSLVYVQKLQPKIEFSVHVHPCSHLRAKGRDGHEESMAPRQWGRAAPWVRSGRRALPLLHTRLGFRPPPLLAPHMGKHPCPQERAASQEVPKIQPSVL